MYAFCTHCGILRQLETQSCRGNGAPVGLPAAVVLLPPSRWTSTQEASPDGPLDVLIPPGTCCISVRPIIEPADRAPARPRRRSLAAAIICTSLAAPALDSECKSVCACCNAPMPRFACFTDQCPPRWRSRHGGGAAGLVGSACLPWCSCLQKVDLRGTLLRELNAAADDTNRAHAAG
jgi:hypothetical protein